jgi:hypothetical protein
MATNRVRMYDITGADALRAAGVGMRRGSRREVSQMLALPAAEPLVATVVHEATHQVCFNTGLLQRYADLPLWLVEGMAAYFEAPGAGGSRGWSGIGRVNARRLATFRSNLAKWTPATLTSLIATDDRLRDPRTAGEAYADAWALNYFLFKKREKGYVAYVQALGQRDPLAAPSAGQTEADKSRERIKEFTDRFGPIDELQRDLVAAMTKL